jgi:hypothetical protein
MATSHRGPASIEADIEETRERLASTIDELLYRTKPATIAERQSSAAKAFFVDPESGQPKQDNIMKVAGAVVGAIVLLAVIRKIVK